jgi:MFS family permease
MSARRRPFYGWWVVFAAAVGLFLSTGSVVVLAFGVFLKPLSRDFHASRAAISLGYTCHNVIAALSAPLLGWMVDRVGARRVILSGTTLFGLILLSGYMLGSRIAFLYLFYALLGLVAGCVSPVPYGVVISNWFDRRRGLALGLIAVGLGLGGVVIPLVAQRLIASFGWRVAYAAFGGAVLFISLPVITTLLVNLPRQKGLQPDCGATTQVSDEQPVPVDGLTWHDIWHDPTFWVMIVAFFLAGVALLGCVLHLPALLTDRGISPQSAAVASSVVGLALLIGRLGTGYLLDYIFAPRLAMFFFGGSAVGVALLWMGGAGKSALLAAFLLGLGMGGEVDLIVYMMSRYFGMRALGTAFGYGFGSYVLAGALGAWMMGAGFDLAHSYSVPLGIFFIAMLAVVGLMTRLGPYRYGAGKAPIAPRRETYQAVLKIE